MQSVYPAGNGSVSPIAQSVVQFSAVDDDYSVDSSVDYRELLRDTPNEIVGRSDDPDLTGHSRYLEYHHPEETIEQGAFAISATIEEVGSIFLNMKDLVKYPPSQILSRAWPLVPTQLKTMAHPPYTPFPVVPTILNVKLPDTDKLAAFLRGCAQEVNRRKMVPSIVYMRCLLLHATIKNDYASTIERSTRSLFSRGEDASGAQWEECQILEMDSFNVQIPTTRFTTVNSLDWIVALNVSRLGSADICTIQCLHAVVDRSGFGTTNEFLNSWGMSHLFTTLLKLLYEPTLKNEWAQYAISLLGKIAFATRSVDRLLSVLKWIIVHYSTSGQLEMKCIAGWIRSIIQQQQSRVKLPVPHSWYKALHIDLAHAFLAISEDLELRQICVVSESSECILFTSKGIFKVSIEPPFTVIASNLIASDTPCRGAFIENNNVSLLLNDEEGSVEVYDSNTLKVIREIHPATKSEIYSGDGLFVTPHFLVDSTTPYCLQFIDCEAVSGALCQQWNINIGRRCESLSVQFFLEPIAPRCNTELRLVHVQSDTNVWLDVCVAISAQNQLLELTFTHGEVVATVEEPILSGWTLWSASLTSLNGVASWTIYKDLVVCESISTSDAQTVVTAPPTLDVLSGTFSGYVSGLQLWKHCQSVSELQNAAMEGATPGNAALLLDIPMNEGSGSTIILGGEGVQWRSSTPLQWSTPEFPLPRRSPSIPTIIPFRPPDVFSVVSNKFEIAIVEPNFCTWIDKLSGRVIEQRSLVLSSEEPCFYCNQSSRFYSFLADEFKIRWIDTQAPLSSELMRLPSLMKPDDNREARGQTTAEDASVRLSNKSSCSQFLRTVADKINKTMLVTISPIHNRALSPNAPAIWDQLGTVSIRTVFRLVDLCKLSFPVIRAVHEFQDTDAVVLQMCATVRMLIYQLGVIERGSPEEITSLCASLIDEAASLPTTKDGLIMEMKALFSELRTLVFAKCVSHRYQLQMILKADDLNEVANMLTAENLTLLSKSITTSDCKCFCTLQEILSTACLKEAQATLRTGNSGGLFPASGALLSVMLSVLADSSNPDRQSFSLRLLCSLCREVITVYESIVTDTSVCFEELIERLQRTCIGGVIFPVAHLLMGIHPQRGYEMELLECMSNMRNTLLRISTSRCSLREVSHSFLEVRTVRTPHMLASPFECSLALPYASSIYIEFSFTGDTAEERPVVSVSILKNDFNRVYHVINPENPVLSVDFPGRVSILCCPQPTESRCLGVLITVSVELELTVENSNWLRDTCVALTDAVISISQSVLLEDTNPFHLIRKDSFLRGGLSVDAQKSKLLPIPPLECNFDWSDSTTLLELCRRGEESPLFFQWQQIYSQSRIPYLDKIESLVRYMVSAVCWHSKPKGLELLDAMNDALQFLKKRILVILEMRQQGKSEEIKDRCLFLLQDVCPRLRMESFLAENQSTEEPVHQTASGKASQFSELTTGNARGRRSANASTVFSRSNTKSKRQIGHSIFQRAIESVNDAVVEQVYDYILNGLENFAGTDDIKSALTEAAQRSGLHTSMYSRLTDICTSHRKDMSTMRTVIDSLLRYRNLSKRKPSHPRNGESVDFVSAEEEVHYLDSLVGGGFGREFDLQKSVCSFIYNILHNVITDPDESDHHVAGATAMSMCAVLCHPWDGVDMSVLRPGDVFSFLRKTIDTYVEGSVEAQEEEDGHLNIGLLGLASRHMIQSNKIQCVMDGIQTMEDSAGFGMQIENVAASFTAQHPWTEHQKFSDHKNTMSPQIYYFEMAIELWLVEPVAATIGVSSIPIVGSTERLADSEHLICLDANGDAHFAGTLVKFGAPWRLGDTVGCGLILPEKQVFFTRNGEFLGVIGIAPFNLTLPYVSINAKDIIVKVVINFGEKHGFKFNFSRLHSSCRIRIVSPLMVSDSAFIVLHYFVATCFKNLQREEANESSFFAKDSICMQLEAATTFIRERIGHLLSAAGYGEEKHVAKDLDYDRKMASLLSLLFASVNIVIDCFKFDSVTSVTHAETLLLCCTALIEDKRPDVQMAATRCLSKIVDELRTDYLQEAFAYVRNYFSDERIIKSLVELSMISKMKKSRTSNRIKVFSFDDGHISVRKKGISYGIPVIPTTGVTKIGFCIRRENQIGGTGASLGGCYYVGLSRGRPEASSVQQILRSRDFFVLQDADDKDQVPRLLFQRNSIPLNSHKRIYGHNEIIWLYFDAEKREIWFYRYDICLGLAFSDVPVDLPLYPFVYMHNSEAQCTLHCPFSTNMKSQSISSNVQRSVAVAALQNLHISQVLTKAVSQFLHDAVERSEIDVEEALVALAVLGSQRSFIFCEHESHGTVVVHSCPPDDTRCVVYLESDESHSLFKVESEALKPTFVEPPLLQFPDMKEESLQCTQALIHKLHQLTFEALALAPLYEEEEWQRGAILKECEAALAFVMVDMVGLLTLPVSEIAMMNDRQENFRESTAQLALDLPIITIDRLYTSNSVFVSCPSIGSTGKHMCGSVVGTILEGPNPKFSVTVQGDPDDSTVHMYVGVCTTADIPQKFEDVASCSSVWAICDLDSQSTNSVNCTVEPGKIYTNKKLFRSGDQIFVSIDRLDGTATISRHRKGSTTDFGVLFEKIPMGSELRPYVFIGSDSVVVFPLPDGVTFPHRAVAQYSEGAFMRIGSTMRCCYCECIKSTEWFVGTRELLCRSCFISWVFPHKSFSRLPEPTGTPFFVSRYPPIDMIPGDIVEIEETSHITWDSNRCINVDILNERAFTNGRSASVSTVPLPMIGDIRVDISLSHVAGFDGLPLGCISQFSPLWRDHASADTAAKLYGGCYIVSWKTIAPSTKASFSLCVEHETKKFRPNGSFFFGVTTYSFSSNECARSVFETSIENAVWGVWTEKREESSSGFELHAMVDTSTGVLRIGNSASNLTREPLHVVGNIPTNCQLRILLYAAEACTAKILDGFMCHSGPHVDTDSEIQKEVVSIGFALSSQLTASIHDSHSLLLCDQISECAKDPRWTVIPPSGNQKQLFGMGDIITFYRRNTTVSVYKDAHLIAFAELPPELKEWRMRFTAFIPIPFASIDVVAAPFGRVQLAKVVSTYANTVAIVKLLYSPFEQRVVHRKDIRFCAPQVTSRVETGTPVMYVTDGGYAPKRGVVVSSTDSALSIAPRGGQWFELPFNHFFLTKNEDTSLIPRPISNWIFPEIRSKGRLFQVGHLKYNRRSVASYNGIMFDCLAHHQIEMTGISVLALTSGMHKVDLFFKIGSHNGYEHNAPSWRQIVCKTVEMTKGTQYHIDLQRPQLVKANSKFALYVNTSNNCAVGFYTDEDGISPVVGAPLDSDGTISVYVGRKSENSISFSDVPEAPRGFCGAIKYDTESGRSPSLVDSDTPKEELPSFDLKRSVLSSQPLQTVLQREVEFRIGVVESNIWLSGFEIPLIQNPKKNEKMPTEVSLSIFFRPSSTSSDGENYNWTWIWRGDHPFVAPTDEVLITLKPLKLPPGEYVFKAELSKTNDSVFLTSLPLNQGDTKGVPTDGSISIANFVGKILYWVDHNNSLAGWTQHEFVTGRSVRSTGSNASYHGLMFDLSARQEIMIEEVFFESQTTADHVSVQIFWREGSMLGSELHRQQWTEVASRTISLQDMQHFSVSTLNLRMKPGQVYSIYVNTSTSCGVRFYNENDGATGKPGDEFENDGILFISIGKKSESEIPFHTVPPDSRSFRGKIVYRAYIPRHEHQKKQAIFSASQAYLIIRLQLSLLSLAEGFSALPLEELQCLLSTVSHIACLTDQAFPFNIVQVEEVAEEALSTVDLADASNHKLSMPFLKRISNSFATIAEGDCVVCVDGSLGKGPLRVVSFPEEKSALVETMDKSHSQMVPKKLLIPVLCCHLCHGPIATVELCSVSGLPHTLPRDATQRSENILTSFLTNVLHMDREKRTKIARSIMLGRDSLSPTNLLSGASGVDPMTLVRCSHVEFNHVVFAIPCLLFAGSTRDKVGNIVCPMTLCPILDANLGIEVERVGTYQLNIFLLTDSPFHLTSLSSIQAFSVSCCLVSDRGEVLYDEGERTSTYVTSRFNGTRMGLDCAIAMLHCSTFSSVDGFVYFKVSLIPTPLPALTPVVPLPEPWVFDPEGKDEIGLDSNNLICFRNIFRQHSSTRSIFTPFTAVSVRLPFAFVEIIIGVGSRAEARCVVLLETNKPYNLVYTAEDGINIFDLEDVLIATLPPTTLSEVRIGFVNKSTEKVFLSLRPPGDVTFQGAECDSVYDPKWIKFNQGNVDLSDDKTKICCAVGQSSQAVLGTELPFDEVCAFAVTLSRSDVTIGASLGSGHFAGIALSSFSELSIPFRGIRERTDLWAVQDVFDNDSHVNQRMINPLNGPKSSLYNSGTMLLFILDRSLGHLYLSRDLGPPELVFHSLPSSEAYVPFVRLDNVATTAVITAIFDRNHIPEHKSCSLFPSRPPTLPQTLRCTSFSIVLSRYPKFAEFFDQLPAKCSQLVRSIWSKPHVSSRFEYRFSQALENMIRLGFFAFPYCNDKGHWCTIQHPEVRKLKMLLSSLPAMEYVTVSLSGGEQRVIFRLPKEYEIIGVSCSEPMMVRLLYCSKGYAPKERTLHVLDGSSSQYDARKSLETNFMVRLPCVMTQVEFIASLSSDSVFGVITEGWYDNILANVVSLSDTSILHVLYSTACALEHWHLHQMVHRNINPHNVYIRFSRGGTDVLQCALWNVWTAVEEPFSPCPESLEFGSSSAEGDIWGCGHLLEHYAPSRSTVLHPLVNSMLSESPESRPRISSVVNVLKELSDDKDRNNNVPVHSFSTGQRFGEKYSGSYYGIMFDIYGKKSLSLTKISFYPDSKCTTRVRLYSRRGSCAGVEGNSEEWTKIFDSELQLNVGQWAELEGFKPVEIYPGRRSSLFLHTDNSSGVSFYSETDGIPGEIGSVFEEDACLGVAVGVKSENETPFINMRSQPRYFRGTLTYQVCRHHNKIRSPMFATTSKLTVHRRDFLSPGTKVRCENNGTEDLGVIHAYDSNHMLYLVELISGIRKWFPASAVSPFGGLIPGPSLRRVPKGIISFRDSQHTPPFMAHRPLKFFVDPPGTDLVIKGTLPTLRGEPLLSESITSSCSVYLRTGTAQHPLPTIGILNNLDQWNRPNEVDSSRLIPSSSHTSLSIDFDFQHQLTAVRCDGKIISVIRNIELSASSPTLLYVTVYSGSGSEPISIAGIVSSLAPKENSLHLISGSAIIRLSTLENDLFVLDDINVVSEVIREEGEIVVFCRSVSPYPSEVRITPLFHPPSKSCPTGHHMSRNQPSTKVVVEPAYQVPTSYARFTIIDAVCMLFLIEVDPLPIHLFSVDRTTEVEMRSCDEDVECLELTSRRVLGIGEIVSSIVVSPTCAETQFHDVEFILYDNPSFPTDILLGNEGQNAWVKLRIPRFSGDLIVEPRVATHIRLWIDMAQRRVLASLNYGVPTEAVAEDPLPPVCFLGFNLKTVGSAARILRWNLCLPSVNTSSLWERVSDIFGGRFPSANIAVEPGAIRRHSARPKIQGIASFGVTSTVEAFMKVLEAHLVLTSRFLLERVLNSSSCADLVDPKKLLKLMPFLPPHSGLDVRSILSRDLESGSVELFVEACAVISSPMAQDSELLARHSIETISTALQIPQYHEFIKDEVAASVMVLLYRASTIFTRDTRHLALRTIQSILHNDACRLPTHRVLEISMQPILSMMHSLCQNNRTHSVVAQIGIDMMVTMFKRYCSERSDRQVPGSQSSIPFVFVCFTSDVFEAIGANPPESVPLALSFMSEAHNIRVMRMLGEPNEAGIRSESCIFSEPSPCSYGTRSFEVWIAPRGRRGRVIVGWNIVSRAVHCQDSSALSPICGLSVEPNGDVYTWLNCKRAETPLTKLVPRTDANFVIQLRCSYHERKVTYMLRAHDDPITTDFRCLPTEHITTPVYYAENHEESEIVLDMDRCILVSQACSLDAPLSASVSHCCEAYVSDPQAKDPFDVPQPLIFYTQLISFTDTVLSEQVKKIVISTRQEKLDPIEVALHDLVSYKTLLDFLEVEFTAKTADIRPLSPYFRRLKAFDELLFGFFQLLNLRHPTYMRALWMQVKPFCTMQARKLIMKEALRGLSDHSKHRRPIVLIHMIQAQTQKDTGITPLLKHCVFGQLYHQLQPYPVSIFYDSPLFMAQLVGFGSQDAGGPYRDVLSQVASEIMTAFSRGVYQRNPLFVQYGQNGQVAIMPNAQLAGLSQAALMLSFFGRMLAFFLISNDLLPVEFPPLFWKLLLDDIPSDRDLLDFDNSILYRTDPQELVDCDVTDFEERFPGICKMWASVQDDTYISDETAPLLAEAIRELEKHRFDDVMNFIRSGFCEVVPKFALLAMYWEDVELAICGQSTLSTEDFRSNCTVKLETADEEMLWRVVTSFSDEDRMMLLRFVTGQSRLPIKQKIMVNPRNTTDSLPTSSTCFFTLNLPRYSSDQVMEDRLLYAIRQCKAIDTDNNALGRLLIPTETD